VPVGGLVIRVVLFGATGMIGQGVLRECFADPDVERVLSVVRAPTGIQHYKLVEMVHPNFHDFTTVSAGLVGYHVCLFCLGVSSAGMTEAQYKAITYDVTIAAASALVRENPAMTFVYISGAGTDSTGRKRSMWARVKGATENALLQMPFKSAYMFRPGYIQPRHGIKSRTPWTRRMYAAIGWAYPLWKLLFRNYVTTTDELAHAMLYVAKHGAPRALIESRDINSFAMR
jgi:uncharacterized protein YbjT (DUF2867 family)